MRRPRFAYGRSIRNAVERARMRQAARLYDLDHTLSRDELMTIEAQDILASSVFEGADDGMLDDAPVARSAPGNES